MDRDNQLKAGETGAWVSIIAYILLASCKLVAGRYGNSEGLTADGLNNMTDVVASIAVLVGLKISRKPPDKDHHYGHYRAETIASLVAAFIMLGVGIEVLINAGQSFFDGEKPVPDWLTAWTALGSAAVMLCVYTYNKRLAKKIDSAAIHAVAQDNRSDALVSIGALVGILGSRIGIVWLDMVAAVVVGLIICRTAWEIFRDASHALTDGFDVSKVPELRRTIKDTAGVKGVTEIKARTHGNQTLIESTILVDPTLTIIEGHAITEAIETSLKKKHGVRYAIIHVEPYWGAEKTFTEKKE
ncbi:cation diffusion facilitator family transporter [Bacillus sp. B-jedd]|uniref:cation diffusion facilitator family transporter n=1 Tax=Bacillus sp. B-jedd TaxID=1476857 RepID=UPI000515708B|nr:cation diffusion facilitator family transporter [Bacillus sp. B-jedd]CEG29691.1 cation efflux family protein [Bacillus sp. B-jedd]